jgi:hypothetical protein
VERSSDSTLDTGEMELSGRDRAAKEGQVGWGVCRVRENLVAGLGWAGLWFCAARDLQRERGEVASEQRRDGMSSKGRKEGRGGRLT